MEVFMNNATYTDNTSNMNHQLHGTTTTGSQTISFPNTTVWDSQTFVPVSPPIFKIECIWDAFKPLSIEWCYWCDKEDNPLTAEQLHHPDTDPHIGYKVGCEHNAVTMIRDHKDNLIIKLEIAGTSHFYVPVPKEIAARFLELMNEHDQDPVVAIPDPWWQFSSGTTVTSTNNLPYHVYGTGNHYHGNHYQTTDGTGVWYNGSAGLSYDNDTFTSGSLLHDSNTISSFPIRAVWAAPPSTSM
jgi:hypothetical protein